jgi:hypothetical protein
MHSHAYKVVATAPNFPQPAACMEAHEAAHLYKPSGPRVNETKPWPTALARTWPVASRSGSSTTAEHRYDHPAIHPDCRSCWTNTARGSSLLNTTTKHTPPLTTCKSRPGSRTWNTEDAALRRCRIWHTSRPGVHAAKAAASHSGTDQGGQRQKAGAHAGGCACQGPQVTHTTNS